MLSERSTAMMTLPTITFADERENHDFTERNGRLCAAESDGGSEDDILLSG
jgi:hypothetical protein